MCAPYWVSEPWRLPQPRKRACASCDDRAIFLANFSRPGASVTVSCTLREARDILIGVRLTPDEVEFLSKKIVKTLVREGKLEIDSEPRIVEAIGKVITDDLMVEDRLNEEVREVLVQHANEMQRSNITYTEMFKMVKKKLAKEKGIIL
jgi:hypothetical protein